MEKQKMQIVLTSSLVLVLIIMVVINFKPKKRRKSVSTTKKVEKTKLPAAPPLPTGPTAHVVTATPKDIEEQKKLAEKNWGLDPFYHIVKQDIYYGAGLKLKGISLSDGQGYAFINSEIVTVGDVISGYKVKEIEKNKVLLKRGTESFYLVMPEE